MSTFDHANLMQGINECLTPFRKSQSEAMQGFGQLDRASMADQCQEQRADCIGHWYHTALLRLCGFSCEGLAQTRLHTRRAGRNADHLRLYGRGPCVDVFR